MENYKQRGHLFNDIKFTRVTNFILELEFYTIYKIKLEKEIEIKIERKRKDREQ